MSLERFPFAQFRRLYEWVVKLADSPHATIALFLIAFAESSFFPIPPDILLVALAVGAPGRAIWFAIVCTAGSVAGAGFGYLLGLQFYELAGRPIIEFYGVQDSYAEVGDFYARWDAIAVGVAGFTPIPFKVFTIAAGAFQINFGTFLLASALSRGARFLIQGILILRFGARIQDLIERYFNLLTVVFLVMLVGGFLLLKYVL